MDQGAYEKVIDLQTERQLRQLDELRTRIETRAIDPAEAASILSRHVGDAALTALAAVRGSDRIHKLIELCNHVINSLSQAADQPDLSGYLLPAQPLELLSLSPAGPGTQAPNRPDAPLAWGALFTGTRADPSLVSQLLSELETADGIDMLVSFVKWSGLRLLQTALQRISDNGKRIRVITTSYMGATDVRAVSWLSSLENCELRISYDTHRTRLHAKAYILHRRSRFSSSYVGSANLSNAAITDGLEWTVKISEHEQPYLYERIAGTFQAYWEDPEFEVFTANDSARLGRAIAEQRAGRYDLDISFDLRPYTFQQEILDLLAMERNTHQRKRQLIVAATGTGKTMIAAFDYRRFCGERNRRPRLLFVAHRIELLKQALGSFRAVLRDPNFGDLLGGGAMPNQREHLFATIQSINSQELLSFVNSTYYEYVVVDEFHHAPAAQYQRLLETLDPLILLGMTATPERMTPGAAGWDVFEFFGNHISAEIRLSDAIQRKLLAPFHYFGVTDTVDFAQVSWARGGYVQAELDNLVTGNHVRAKHVLTALNERVTDSTTIRGLGFCVSVKHAEFMAEFFRSHGLDSYALTSESSLEDRNELPKALRDGRIRMLFTVDLFNEGIDIPELDTILLLRPTESLTVFLQQLGRGLRLSEGKECLTALDFVGHMHKRFRFDDRLRALSTKPQPDMREQVAAGFPWLPAGCHFELEEQAMRHVLENINGHLGTRGKSEWAQLLREFAHELSRMPTLHEFLNQYQRQPVDLFRLCSWHELASAAGLLPTVATNNSEKDALLRLASIDDDLRIAGLRSVLAGDRIDDERLTLMLCALILPRTAAAFTLSALHDYVAASPVLCHDLPQLLDYIERERGIHTVSPTLRAPLPLRLHATYTRGEILSALGAWTAANRFNVQSGNHWMSNTRTDALFVTLNKSSREFSPTTMYEDYAISDRLFHWQSQSSIAAGSPRALRYIDHKAQENMILLFVRENRKRNGLAEPFVYLGPVEHVDHKDSKPVSITWRIQTPMPARFVREMQHLTA